MYMRCVFFGFLVFLPASFMCMPDAMVGRRGGLGSFEIGITDDCELPYDARN